MKRLAIFLAIVAFAALGSAAFLLSAPAPMPLAHFAPAGALLSLQAQDFGALLSQWNTSPQKHAWLTSSNYEAFSRSRLFLNLKQAGVRVEIRVVLPILMPPTD